MLAAKCLSPITLIHDLKRLELVFSTLLHWLSGIWLCDALHLQTNHNGNQKVSLNPSQQGLNQGYTSSYTDYTHFRGAFAGAMRDCYGLLCGHEKLHFLHPPLWNGAVTVQELLDLVLLHLWEGGAFAANVL